MLNRLYLEMFLLHLDKCAGGEVNINCNDQNFTTAHPFTCLTKQLHDFIFKGYVILQFLSGLSK